MDLDLRRDRIFLIVASLILMSPLLMIYGPAGGGMDHGGYQFGRDFINVWVGPQVAFGDGVAKLFDLLGYHEAVGALYGRPLPFYNWGYPLFTLPAFWPLAQLPYFWALAVWTIGTFAAFAAVVLSQIEPSRRLHALVLLAIAPVCLINAISGQNGFLSAALFLGGILNIERRPILAGVLFGLLTFKPHLGVVLPFALVALGAWRVILAAAATAIALVAASTALFGLDAWVQYVSQTSAFQIGLLQQIKGFYANMMVSVLACLRFAGVSYANAMAVQVVVSVAAIAGATWAVRRVSDACVRAFILVIATLLATPYAFNYDMTALMAVLVWMMAGRLPWRASAGPVCLLAWLAPPAVMLLPLLGLRAVCFVTLVYLFGLFALAMREARGEGVPRLAAA